LQTRAAPDALAEAPDGEQAEFTALQQRAYPDIASFLLSALMRSRNSALATIT
jgi:hypothetical protein